MMVLTKIARRKIENAAPAAAVAAGVMVATDIYSKHRERSQIAKEQKQVMQKCTGIAEKSCKGKRGDDYIECRHEQYETCIDNPERQAILVKKRPGLLSPDLFLNVIPAGKGVKVAKSAAPKGAAFFKEMGIKHMGIEFARRMNKR